MNSSKSVDIESLKAQIRDEIIESLRNDTHFQRRKQREEYRAIMDIAKKAYSDNGYVYPDMFAQAFSMIIRNTFAVSRLDQLQGDELDKAIEMAGEIADVVRKYRKEEDDNGQTSNL